MNYWITTHWPPTEDEEDSEPAGVWLPDKREQAGYDLEIGDKVLIYQSLTGRMQSRNIKGKIHKIKSKRGKQGIIAIVEVVSNLTTSSDPGPIQYVDGSEIWWHWHAETKPISTNGYVPLSEVNRVLEYSQRYNLRGFGDYKSGLKKITEEQFHELVNLFKQQPRSVEPIRTSLKNIRIGKRTEGESKDHKNLKEFVAHDPAAVLGEVGLHTIKVEYEFPTGDRADVVLADRYGRVIGLEVELSINENQIEGILQAIKYRYMLALMTERKNYETRAMLVAHEMSEEIKQVCQTYEVEFFLINPVVVEKWLS